MKCPDCKCKQADVEIVVNGKVRTVCGNCKRKAYVVYPEPGEVADVSRAEQADAEGGLPEVPAGDVHHDEAEVPDA